MRVVRIGDWDLSEKILRAGQAGTKRALKMTVVQEAHLARNEIVRSFQNEGPPGKKWKPLSPLYRRMKEKTHPGRKVLSRDGDLKQSVTVVTRGQEAFIGILRNARAGRTRGPGGRFIAGRKLISVAETHEFGAGPYAIRVTDRMRRFLMAAFREAGMGGGGRGGGGLARGIIIVKIPARPFVRPAFERLFKPRLAKRRITERLRKNLETVLSTAG